MIDNNYEVVKQKHGNVIYSLKTHEKARERKENYLLLIKWVNIILIGSILVVLILQLILKMDLLNYIGIALSIIEFIFIVIQLNFDLQKDIYEHIKASNQLWLAREKYLNLLVDIKNGLDKEKISAKRDVYDEQLSEIYKNAIKTSNKDYKEASKVLNADEKPRSDDEEYKNFLPENLWS